MCFDAEDMFLTVLPKNLPKAQQIYWKRREKERKTHLEIDKKKVPQYLQWGFPYVRTYYIVHKVTQTDFFFIKKNFKFKFTIEWAWALYRTRICCRRNSGFDKAKSKIESIVNFFKKFQALSTDDGCFQHRLFTSWLF